MTTNRLSYSTNGQIRLLEMTQSDLVIFTEGISDRFFYDQIASVVCSPMGISYQIRSGEELSGTTGGKKVLLAYYEVLNNAGKLHGKKGNRASVFFFMDKDIDDLKKTKINSKHIAYTKHYHLENYLFIWGDLHYATSAVVGLDVNTIKRIIGDVSSWRENAAFAWKHWVYICVHATIDKIASGANYHSCSQIHQGCSCNIDAVRQAKKEMELRIASGLTKEEFQLRQNQIRKIVDDLYSKGEYDCVFKGQWYIKWLESTISSSSKRNRHIANKISSAISPSLLLTLNFSGKWCEHLRQPLLQIATQHNMSTV
jgi:hypothetical protein